VHRLQAHCLSKYETQEFPFFKRRLIFEQGMGIVGEFEQFDLSST
jgi:hypothetical protein